MHSATSSCPDPAAEHLGCKTRSFPGSLLFLGPRAGWPPAQGLASGHHCHLPLHSTSSRTRSLAGFSSRGSISSRQDFCPAKAPAREGEGLLAWRQCGGGRLRPQSPSADVLPWLSSPETDEGPDLGAAGPNGGISFLEQMKRRFLFAICCFREGFPACSSRTVRNSFRFINPATGGAAQARRWEGGERRKGNGQLPRELRDR